MQWEYHHKPIQRHLIQSTINYHFTVFYFNIIPRLLLAFKVDAFLVILRQYFLCISSLFSFKAQFYSSLNSFI